MMIGELPAESSSMGRKRKRSPPPPQPQPQPQPPTVLSLPAVGNLKDVNICVRLEYNHLGQGIDIGCKWVRLKIPGILLRKRQQYSPPEIFNYLRRPQRSIFSHCRQSPEPEPERRRRRSRHSPERRRGRSRHSPERRRRRSRHSPERKRRRRFSRSPGRRRRFRQSLERFPQSPERRGRPQSPQRSEHVSEHHHHHSPEIEEEKESGSSDYGYKLPTSIWDKIFPNDREIKPPRTIYYYCIQSTLEPINGPFVFEPTLVETKSTWNTSECSCAAIGSVIYALGNDETHLPDAKQLRFDAFWGGPLDALSPAPVSSSSSSTSTGPGVILNASHRLHFCDFSKQHPTWEIHPAPLISPRLYPRLVSLHGKLYAFGGNHLLDGTAPFAEVYDPQLGSWQPLPDPPFPRLPYCQLFVFPLPESHEILVVGCEPSSTCYRFNTLWSSWFPSSCPHLSRVLYAPQSTPFVPVKLGRNLYCWIDMVAQLCVYNLETGQFYKGDIIPCDKDELDHEDLFQFLKSYEVNATYALIPISSSLLAILWSVQHDIAPGVFCGSTLHVTLVNISLHQPIEFLDDITLQSDLDSDSYSESEHRPSSNRVFFTASTVVSNSLTAYVVACLCFPLVAEVLRVVDAHTIDADTGIWQSMSSCSLYHDIARKA